MKPDRSKNVKALFWACIGFAAALLFDQYTKYLAVAHLKEQKPLVLIDGVFSLTYLENRGAAFGLFQNKQYLFVAGAAIILILVVFLYVRMPFSVRYCPLRICGVLLCAGAVGNMIDRIGQGYVVDFLYFKLINFPIFNVADCYVTISAFLLILLVFFYYREEEMACFSLRKKEEKSE